MVYPPLRAAVSAPPESGRFSASVPVDGPRSGPVPRPSGLGPVTTGPPDLSGPPPATGRSTAYADGAPPAGDPPGPPGGGGPTPGPGPGLPRPASLPERIRSRIESFEGRRGLSTRRALWLRYASYYLTVVLCSATTHAAFSRTSLWRSGGLVMFFSATVMVAAAALATFAFTNYRGEILAQLRHFLFGICCFPGVGVALFLWALQRFLSNPAARDDVVTNVAFNAIPIVYFTTVVLPVFVFVKMVFGLRTFHRSRLDDEEMLRLYARQDGLQR